MVEKVAGTQFNFDKSEGLRLGAWRWGHPSDKAISLE